MKEQKLSGWISCICVICLIAIYLSPFFAGGGMMLNEANIFHKFLELFSNNTFLLALKNTIIFTILCVLSINGLGFVLAYLMAQIKNKSLFYGLLVPIAIPVITTTTFWVEVLKVLPLQFTFGDQSLLIVLAIYLWKYVGFTILIYYSGLKSLPKSYIEAAQLDGASKIKCIWHIIIPQLRSFMSLNTLFAIIHSFKVFRDIYLLYGNYPPSSIYLIQHFIQNNYTSLNYDYVVTASSIFTLVSFVILLPLLIVERKNDI